MNIKNFLYACGIVVAPLLVSCSESDGPTPPDTLSDGLFIINQGNFLYGNSSVTFYSPDRDEALQEVFLRANDFKLGDMAQSMTVYRNSGWIVVNGSNVIFEVDLNDFKEKGRIDDGIFSPRYIHFISSDKAYVTQLYDNRIAIVDPRKYEVTGYITVPDMDVSTGSTEMIVQIGDYAYVNCWSYNRSILKIDVKTDRIVDVLETVGIQPKAMAVDRSDNIWVITDGGYYGSPYGYQNPTIEKINTASFTVDLCLELELGANISTIITNGARDTLYWIANDVYSMSVDSQTLPAEPIISAGGNWLNGLTVDPLLGDIYVADALDYVQNGQLLRYSSSGGFITKVVTGIIPGGFCWKR